LAEAPVLFTGPVEPAAGACAAPFAPEEPAVCELAAGEFEAFDGALGCAAGGWLAGAALDEPFAGEPMFCRTSEKLCDGALDDVELAGAGGAELGAIIFSRIASVMNRAACA